MISSSDGMSERRELDQEACEHKRVTWKRGTLLNVERGVCLDCDTILVRDRDEEQPPEPPRAA